MGGGLWGYWTDTTPMERMKITPKRTVVSPSLQQIPSPSDIAWEEEISAPAAQYLKYLHLLTSTAAMVTPWAEPQCWCVEMWDWPLTLPVTATTTEDVTAHSRPSSHHSVWALLLTAPHCSSLLLTPPHCSSMLLTAPHCSLLLHIASHYSLLLLTAPDCSSVILIDPHCFSQSTQLINIQNTTILLGICINNLTSSTFFHVTQYFLHFQFINLKVYIF